MFINFLRYVQKKERIFIGNQIAFEKELLRFQTNWKEIAEEYGLVPVAEYGPGCVALNLYTEGAAQCLRYDVPEERAIVEGFAGKTNTKITAYKLGDSNV